MSNEQQPSSPAGRERILRIRRTQGWVDFRVQVAEDAYLLDALEAAGRQDPSLLFRHACHHTSCGSCGVRVNGHERLACATRISSLGPPERPIRVEPLRNFPLVGDLVVDLGELYRRLGGIDLPPIRAEEEAQPRDGASWMRFESCIECGLCVSACPIAATHAGYWGPAALAAAWRIEAEPRGHAEGSALATVENGAGIWRCHSVYACSEVCPAEVDPAAAIMQLRRRAVSQTIFPYKKREKDR